MTSMLQQKMQEEMRHQLQAQQEEMRQQLQAMQEPAARLDPNPYPSPPQPDPTPQPSAARLQPPALRPQGRSRPLPLLTCRISEGWAYE